MKEIVKAIYDISKERKVDVDAAAAMYQSEHEGVDTKEAEKYIHEHYNDLCEAYTSGDENLWNECFPDENTADAE